MLGLKRRIVWVLVVVFLTASVYPLLADDEGKGKKRRKDIIDLVYVEKPVVGLPHGLKAIAFIPFSQVVEDKEGIFSAREKKMGDELTSAIAQRMQECSRQFDIPLNIVDRESVAAIMKEKDLADAGLAQESKALQLGKLAHAEAICFGRMTIDVHKVEGTSSTFRPVPGRHGIRLDQEEVRSIRRTITVSATVKLVATATGKSILTFNKRASDTVERKPGLIMGEDAQEIQLRPEDEVIERLFNQLVDEFVGQLLPHEIRLEVKVVEPKNKLSKMALKFMKTGDYEKAIELFQEGLASKPDDHAALYDLGLAYEITGNLKNALKSYEQAYRFKDKDYYLDAAQRARQKMNVAKAESESSPTSTQPADNESDNE
ncbi:MAG: tetratricopeptide repeat protein [Phycisphaerae bacterium]